MDLCKEAGELAQNVIFNTILIAVIIISTIAIFFEIWIMVKTTNHILVHQNTRILIIMHQFWLILYCIARIFAHIYLLVAHWKTYVDQCGYLMFPWECFMMRIPITLTAFLNATSIPSIVIERAIATYFSSRYEKFGKSIAIILIIAQIVIAIGSLLYVFIDFNLLDSEKIIYCAAANYKDGPKVAVIFGIYATVAFLCALIFPILFYINKRFHCNKIHVNLSHRYQIIENITSIQTFIPMVAFYSLFLTLYLGAISVYFAFGFEFSLRNVICLESVQQTPTYALTLPFAIFWTEKYVKRSTQKNRQKAMELTGTETANYYFTVFEAPEEKNSRKLQR